MIFFYKNIKYKKTKKIQKEKTKSVEVWDEEKKKTI